MKGKLMEKENIRMQLFTNKSLQSFFKFGIVGVLNTIVDMIVFAGLITLSIPIVPAQCMSYGAGIINSYLFNRQWTFRVKGNRSIKEPLKFLTVNLVTLFIVTVLLKGLYEHVGVSLLLAKVIATFVGVVINFIGSRYWVFRPALPTED